MNHQHRSFFIPFFFRPIRLFLALLSRFHGFLNKVPSLFHIVALAVLSARKYPFLSEGSWNANCESWIIIGFLNLITEDGYVQKRRK
ncbi:hypothetical protein HNQ92_005051 [Rhabdobacter roseus]|uniref:Uncharacterized protein n=1 Tax=Rhabdobacter roseus TaxID=1655419 RepID=A0A840U507_9BACT|nr:hypothetical protein [Rhabdobacter roseus]